MGEHLNTKKNTTKRHKAGFSEGRDIRVERGRRVTFKNFIQNLEDDLLEQELEAEEWILERGITIGDETTWHELGRFASETDADEELQHEEASAGKNEQYRIRRA